MKYKYCFELSEGFLGVCVGGGECVGGGQAAQGGKIPRVILPPGDKLPGFGVGLGQDKLLHRLKLDTDEETNHLIELSHKKCIPQ